MASLIPLVKPSDFPREVQLQWYKIRDMFFGDNLVRDILPALELAKSCKYPDAEWLTSMCGHAQSKLDVLLVFQNPNWDDARALCFSYKLRIVPIERLDIVERAAKLGYAFAQYLMSWSSYLTDAKKQFEFATLAANQGERDGFYALGYRFSQGLGCEKNLYKAKENYLHACKLDDALSMDRLSALLDNDDPTKWYWQSRAAKLGCTAKFLSTFVSAVRFNPRNENVFLIGQALNGQIDCDKRQIFNCALYFAERLPVAQTAVAFYLHQIESYRKAVFEWIKVGRKLKVCKDIRKVIGMLVWNSRGEALYEMGETTVLPFNSNKRVFIVSKRSAHAAAVAE